MLTAQDINYPIRKAERLAGLWHDGTNHSASALPQGICRVLRGEKMHLLQLYETISCYNNLCAVARRPGALESCQTIPPPDRPDPDGIVSNQELSSGY
jgi:hypothetical protein